MKQGLQHTAINFHKANVQNSAKYKTTILQEDDEVAIRWRANEDMRCKKSKKIKKQSPQNTSPLQKTSLPKQFYASYHMILSLIRLYSNPNFEHCIV